MEKKARESCATCPSLRVVLFSRWNFKRRLQFLRSASWAVSSMVFGCAHAGRLSLEGGGGGGRGGERDRERERLTLLQMMMIFSCFRTVTGGFGEQRFCSHPLALPPSLSPLPLSVRASWRAEALVYGQPRWPQLQAGCLFPGLWLDDWVRRGQTLTLLVCWIKASLYWWFIIKSIS